MDSGVIIGVLAFVTIGLVLLIAIYHFGTFLKDPRNRGHAKNVANDGPAATTKVRQDAAPGSHEAKPLKERLDSSEASAHPRDPEALGHGR